MITLTKTKLSESGILNGLTDCHSHLLPGVDDGIQSIEESLAALAFYESQGVKRIFLTPHVMEDIPANNARFLREQFEKLRSAYQGSIDIELGAEYMIDAGLSKHIESGELLTLSGKYILVETSGYYKPLNFDRTVDDLHSLGLHVLLAHPERYEYMDKSDYMSYKDRNIKFQLNMLSLIGIYGKRAKEKSHELLRYGSYDCIGSDIHDLAFYKKAIDEGKVPGKIIRQIEEVKNRNFL